MVQANIYVILIYEQLFWLLAYTSYIVKVYLVSCPCDYFSRVTGTSKATEPSSTISNDLRRGGGDGMKGPVNKTDSENKCQLETGLTSDAIVVLLLTFFMTINEVVKIITIPRLYIKSKLNVANWILILMVILTIAPVLMEKGSKPDSWQYEAAAVRDFEQFFK
jgi:hypothetical protein